MWAFRVYITQLEEVRGDLTKLNNSDVALKMVATSRRVTPQSLLTAPFFFE